MKKTQTPVSSQETVTATKSATPRKGNRIATSRNAKQDITPEAKKKLDTNNLKDDYAMP